MKKCFFLLCFGCLVLFVSCEKVQNIKTKVLELVQEAKTTTNNAEIDTQDSVYKNFSIVIENANSTTENKLQKSNISSKTKWEKTADVDTFGDPTGRIVYSVKGLTGFFVNGSERINDINWDLYVDNKGVSTIVLNKEGDSSSLLKTGTYTRVSIVGHCKDGGLRSSSCPIGLVENETLFNAIVSVDIREWLAEANYVSFKIRIDNAEYDLGSIDTSSCETLFYDYDGFMKAEKLKKQGLYEEAMQAYDSLDLESFDYFECLGKIKECENIVNPIVLDTISNVEYDYSIYSIGGIGPAGGYVFYDCDADNENGNLDGLISSECGWRFIEAAPNDIEINGKDKFVFGYFKSRPDSTNDFLVTGTTKQTEGTSNPNDGKGTGEAVGTGYANTIKLVKTMRDSAYLKSNEPDSTNRYAARLCYDYTCEGYDDWFLPSYEELYSMYSILHNNGIGNFKNDGYWSSSEYVSWGMIDAKNIDFEDPTMIVYDWGRGSRYHVRPVHYF